MKGPNIISIYYHPLTDRYHASNLLLTLTAQWLPISMIQILRLKPKWNQLFIINKFIYQRPSCSRCGKRYISPTATNVGLIFRRSETTCVLISHKSAYKNEKTDLVEGSCGGVLGRIEDLVGPRLEEQAVRSPAYFQNERCSR